MSAFIVAPDCINSIVTYLYQHPEHFRRLKRELGYDVAQSDDLRRLAIDLYHLNCDAVDQRYGKSATTEDESESFAFCLVRRESIAVHKAACCLHYQCSEGNVPEQPLYEALKTIVARIADLIVSKLPTYDEAPWGD
jgi:hypothetical protein